ncbi:hypothetical protein DMUE_0038 [Dictyocoela muelleri]|nr:hypothetical protein DMUE_0038 [Dictyocoela muelleri]
MVDCTRFINYSYIFRFKILIIKIYLSGDFKLISKEKHALSIDYSPVVGIPKYRDLDIPRSRDSGFFSNPKITGSEKVNPGDFGMRKWSKVAGFSVDSYTKNERKGSSLNGLIFIIRIFISNIL